MPRVASSEAPEGQEHAASNAVRQDRLARVLRARRRESTRRRQERPHEQLVHSHERSGCHRRVQTLIRRADRARAGVV